MTLKNTITIRIWFVSVSVSVSEAPVGGLRILWNPSKYPGTFSQQSSKTHKTPAGGVPGESGWPGRRCCYRCCCRCIFLCVIIYMFFFILLRIWFYLLSNWISCKIIIERWKQQGRARLGQSGRGALLLLPLYDYFILNQIINLFTEKWMVGTFVFQRFCRLCKNGAWYKKGLRLHDSSAPDI